MKGNMMNRTRAGLALIVGLATIAAIPTTASAQTSGFGYVFGGPVGVSNVPMPTSPVFSLSILPIISATEAGHERHAPGEPIALWNVAGGVDWWLGRHTGLRLEVRDQLAAVPAFLGFRVGVVFR